MRRPLPPLLAALVLAATGLAACANEEEQERVRIPTIAADAITLDGRSTTLAVDALTVGVLRDNGISLTPLPPARAERAGRAGVTFPVTGGRIDGASVGTIEHAGGLRFGNGTVAVDATDFVIDTAEGQLLADVGGRRLALLDLSLEGLQRVEDVAGTVVVSGITTTLNAGAASALNEALATSVFNATLELGSATVRLTGSY